MPTKTISLQVPDSLAVPKFRLGDRVVETDTESDPNTVFYLVGIITSVSFNKDGDWLYFVDPRNDAVSEEYGDFEWGYYDDPWFPQNKLRKFDNSIIAEMKSAA